MTITTQALGTSYLADNQLPTLLKQLEGYLNVVYGDTKGFASIGIGINIGQSGTDKNLALILNYLGLTVTPSIVQGSQVQVADYVKIYILVHDALQAKLFTG